MARIRTVKPEFFRHYGLYMAEKETGLPLRIAFEGLWTCADREGRFKWVPQQLKLDCLPYDEVDFPRVLHALAARGFIEKYCESGVDYGWIPSFTEHQVINNREKASNLPEPTKDNIIRELTRASRVDDACPTPLNQDQGEGKGREGKGKGVKPKPKFKPPTLEEVRAYCQERRNNVDPTRWMNHYTSNGFKVGKNPMQDWKAAVRTWEEPNTSKPQEEFPAI